MSMGKSIWLVERARDLVSVLAYIFWLQLSQYSVSASYVETDQNLDGEVAVG